MTEQQIRALFWATPLSVLQEALDDLFTPSEVKAKIEAEIARRNAWRQQNQPHQ